MLLLALLLPGGCFAAITAYRDGLICTPEAARQAGSADARAGRPLDDDYAETCGVAELPLNRMYQEAYDSVPADERDRPGWLGRLLGRDPTPRTSDATP